MAEFDLAIIGGGINGAGIARDAAGRGLRVLLVEQNDLASGTSSKSTKLIHGGLRYLEHGAFRLVREALVEREVLSAHGAASDPADAFRAAAPFGLRPAWMLRLGLFLYDHLGGRKILPGTETLDLTHHKVGEPLRREFRQGFEYSDCWVDDARLVVLNAVDAAERGAVIRTRTRLMRAERSDKRWQLVLSARGNRETVTARGLVNAAGPWVAGGERRRIGWPTSAPVRLVKGSHIVVRRLFEHDHAYIFQNADGRIVFAIPYERDFTLIGTTDEDFEGGPGARGRDPARDHLPLPRRQRLFPQSGDARSGGVHAFAGVRPLYDDGARKAQEATRDYVLELDGACAEAPLLTIYGGKITTYRRLAEEALKRLAPLLRWPAWTMTRRCRAATFPGTSVAAFTVSRARQLWPVPHGDAGAPAGPRLRHAARPHSRRREAPR